METFPRGGIPMKIIKKIAMFGFAVGLAGAGVSALALQRNQSMKPAMADIAEQHYVPVNTANFYSGEFDIGAQICQGNDTFFDPGRFYGTTRPLLNTVSINEGKTGDIRSYPFNQTGEYVSFVMGGNGKDHIDGEGHPMNFINVWDEDRGYNVASFVANTAFSDPNISCNMVFKYVQIPADHRGRTLIYIHDGTGSNFGGVTFGELRINQTWEDVVESFSAHLATYKLSCNNQANIDAYNAVKNLYDTDAYYSDLRTALASKTSADDGFEKKNGLTNWAYDRVGSTYPNGDLGLINFESIISDNDYKTDSYFSAPMPANKTGNYYLNADTSGVYEDFKYRLVSSEFTLSGTGLISAKLGGGTAVLQLLNSNYEVVASTSTNASGENPILNPAFVAENGDSRLNIVSSGTRLNTMSRVFLDCSAYLGQRVRVAISDDRHGFNWGLSYFDEVVTYYSTLPSFRLDKITQTNNEETYRGVVTDKYVGPNNTTFGEAYAFVSSFYSTMRDPSNAVSWCSISASQAVQDVVDDYGDLSPSAKAIVDASQDYTYGKNVTSSNWYFADPDTTTYTIGATMAYLTSGEVALASSPLDASRFFGMNGSNSAVMIAILSSVIVISLAFIGFMVYNKKRKAHK